MSDSRSLPSNVWAALALPYPPIGSIPFVDSDGQSIRTDVQHFLYTYLGSENATDGTKPYQLTAFGGLRIGYTDAFAIVGTPTINKPSGRVKIPTGFSTVQVICSYSRADSVILVFAEFPDTLNRLTVVASLGSFIINGNVAASTDLPIKFIIFNTMLTGP